MLEAVLSFAVPTSWHRYSGLVTAGSHHDQHEDGTDHRGGLASLRDYFLNAGNRGRPTTTKMKSRRFNASSFARYPADPEEKGNEDPDDKAEEEAARGGGGAEGAADKDKPTPVFGHTESGDKCKCTVPPDGKMNEHTAESREYELKLKEAAMESTAAKSKIRRQEFHRNLRWYKKALADLDRDWATFEHSRDLKIDAYAHLRKTYAESCRPLEEDYELDLPCSRMYQKGVSQYFKRGMPPSCKYGTVAMITPFRTDMEEELDDHARWDFGHFLD